MNPPVKQRVSPNRVALIFALLLAAWLVFEFYPRRAPGPADNLLARVPTKLELAGLPEGQDFEGVPAFFAAFADQAEWRDNRTRFAYWHPVMKNYSYHFEATRVGGRYHFREIPEPDRERYALAEDLPDDCPLRFYRSVPVPTVTGIVPLPTLDRPDVTPDAPKVKLDRSQPDALPPPDVPNPKSLAH